MGDEGFDNGTVVLFRCQEKGCRSVEVARIYCRAAVDKEVDDVDMARRGRMTERHGTQTIARPEGSAIVE